MQDALKNFLYAGVGLATDATDKFEKAFNDLVEKGKLSDSEAKNYVEDFFSKTETKSSEFEGKVNDFFGKWGYVKKTDYDSLLKRVEELEKTGSEKPAKTATKAQSN